MTDASVEKVSPGALAARAERLEKLGEQLQETFPPAQVGMEHHLHAGVYTRTVYIPKGVAIVGVTIKLATQVICCGHLRLTDGGVTKELRGVHILEGNPGRKAAAYALENSSMTMLFATSAKTVEEAENEFTEEPERLLTRKEALCLE